jgi:multiple antibiotic resistance protein
MTETSIKYYWEDMPVGSTRDLGTITPTAEEIVAFATQFDPQPFHLDEEAAKQSVFGGLCASGWHTCSMAMRLMVTNFLLESSSQGSPGLETHQVMDLKPLITLLAIVNPLAIVPFFIHYTQGFSAAQRRSTIRTAAFASFCVIAACALLGLQILEFFNISLQSFQVGGGMLLLISAMNMLNAQPAEAKPSTNEYEEGAEKAAAGSSIAVVPLTIPLLTGPASMSTVVIYADRAQTFWQHAALVGYGVVIALATAVCFSLADPIARVLGKTGINVMTRLMGLILAALAVEVMTDGLGKIFPVLIAR